MATIRKSKPLTSKKLQCAFYNKFYGSHEAIIPNVFVEGNIEMDLLCITKSQLVHEIEIKLSVADFKNDFLKEMWQGEPYKKVLKHESMVEGNHLANKFSFLVPYNIEEKVEVPDYAGLYVYTKTGRIEQRQKPKTLHKNKIELETKYSLIRKINYRYWNYFLK